MHHARHAPGRLDFQAARLMMVIVFFLLLDRLGRGRRVVVSMARIKRVVPVNMRVGVLVRMDKITVAMFVGVCMRVLVHMRCRYAGVFVCHLCSP